MASERRAGSLAVLRLRARDARERFIGLWKGWRRCVFIVVVVVVFVVIIVVVGVVVGMDGNGGGGGWRSIFGGVVGGDGDAGHLVPLVLVGLADRLDAVGLPR